MSSTPLKPVKLTALPCAFKPSWEQCQTTTGQEQATKGQGKARVGALANNFTILDGFWLTNFIGLDGFRSAGPHIMLKFF